MNGDEIQKRIMVIDDDVDSLNLYEQVAKSRPIIVYYEFSALQALITLNKLNFDIDAIILDLSMPDMDGVTLTEQIRQNENLRSKRRQIEIFWYTGWPYDPNDRHNPIVIASKVNRVREIFMKPTDIVSMIVKVEEIISGAPE